MPSNLDMGASNNHHDNCEEKYREFHIPTGEIYCNWTWDNVLCWPPTRAGSSIAQNCPNGRGVDSANFVHKRCLADGHWEGSNLSLPQGWTNYTTCLTFETITLLKKLEAGPEDAVTFKMTIAARTRVLELIGFTISLMALIISLVIFYKFTAMVIQVIVRLTLYIDQAIVRSPEKSMSLNIHQGIENTALLCEASYVLLEYARTAMFMWMFIEGLYLHSKVTVFHEQSHYAVYNWIGWGFPFILTSSWATVAGFTMKTIQCWWFYNLRASFWILEGPRMAVVILNFLFLLNIIRVLIVKLQQTHTSEIEQVRKAVRAAIVLVPLLGITNIIGMAEAPLDRALWEFALWSYLTHFLTSFQGFFIAFIYCFLNGEVRSAIQKSITLYLSFHTRTPRRNSYLSGIVATVVDSPPELENNMRHKHNFHTQCEPMRRNETSRNDRWFKMEQKPTIDEDQDLV